MKILEKKSGFSVVETMLAIAIFSLLSLSVISFFIWTITIYSKLQAMNMVAKNIDVALTAMVYEIREAQSIYYPTSTSTQISLKTYHNLPDNEEISYVDIYLCETQVCIKREGEEVEYLTSDQVLVTDLEFTYIATSTAPSVYIEMSVINSTYDEGREDNYSIDFHSAATLRQI
ncbi:hypothetical protein C0583_00545 [Candidatus Parcubacteria bacterium]|nr:MAG: hypothetical protein C0583_00545 [Candidatus Parcubacteria bacterium]